MGGERNGAQTDFFDAVLLAVFESVKSRSVHKGYAAGLGSDSRDGRPGIPRIFDKCSGFRKGQGRKSAPGGFVGDIRVQVDILSVDFFPA